MVDYQNKAVPLPPSLKLRLQDLDCWPPFLCLWLHFSHLLFLDNNSNCKHLCNNTILIPQCWYMDSLSVKYCIILIIIFLGFATLVYAWCGSRSVYTAAFSALLLGRTRVFTRSLEGRWDAISGYYCIHWPTCNLPVLITFLGFITSWRMANQVVARC